MADQKKALDIIVSAKDQASAVLANIASKTKSMIASVNKGGGIFGGAGGTDADRPESRLARAFEITGKVRLGLEGANIAARLLKGDIEGAADASERLPFGIGATSRALRETLGYATGISDEIERAKKAVEDMDASRMIQVKLVEGSKVAREQLAKMNDELERQIRLLGKDGLARSLEAIQQARDAATAQAKETGGEANKQATADARARFAALQTDLIAKQKALEESQKSAAQILDPLNSGKRQLPQFQSQKDEIARIKADMGAIEAEIKAAGEPIAAAVEGVIRTANRKAIAEAREAGNSAVAELLKGFAATLIDKLKAGRDFQERLKDINAEAAQSLLRAAGRDYDADLLAFNRYWDKRITAAESGVEREALIRAKAAALKEKEADRDREQANDAMTEISRNIDSLIGPKSRFMDPTVTGAESRFGTGFAQSAREKAMAEQSKPVVDELKTIFGGTQAILRELQESRRNAVVLESANL